MAHTPISVRVKKSHWVFVPERHLILPDTSGLYTCLHQNWWTFVPGKGLVFYRGPTHRWHVAPQCNTNKQITKRMIENGHKPEGSVAMLVVHAFIPTTTHEGTHYIPTTWDGVTTEEIVR